MDEKEKAQRQEMLNILRKQMWMKPVEFTPIPADIHNARTNNKVEPNTLPLWWPRWTVPGGGMRESR